MKIQKLIIAALLLTICLALYAESDESSDIAPLILESITFLDVDNTNEDYLRDVIALEKGATWNAEVKARVKERLEKLKDVISEVSITEEIVEGDRVNVSITVNEKIAILPIPYFSWSLGGGFVPKFTLRFYNLAGRRKRLITKFHFKPLEDVFGEISYHDNTIFTDERLKLMLKYNISSSIISYNIHSQPLFMGAIGGRATELQPWNEELFMKNFFETNVSYSFPGTNVTINPYLKFEHNRIFSAHPGTGSENIGETPIDDLDLKGGFDTSLRFGNGIGFTPKFALTYKLDSDNSSDINYLSETVKGHLSNGVAPSLSLTVDFPIKPIDAYISPFTSLDFEYTNHLFSKNTTTPLYDSNKDTSNLTLKFGVKFKKNKTIGRFKHEFEYKTTFTQPLLLATYTYAEGLYYGTLVDTLKIQNELTYKMEFMIHKSHQLNFKVYCFGNYNETYEPGGYAIGERPGSLTGWVGLMFNLSYYLPLFSFTTPKIGSFSIDKELKWTLFWDFFIDAGVAQNYEATNTTINLNHLHLAPALAAGTRFRIVPDFMPVYFEIKFGLDLYTMLKTKDIGSTISFAFGFPDNF